MQHTFYIICSVSDLNRWNAFGKIRSDKIKEAFWEASTTQQTWIKKRRTTTSNILGSQHLFTLWRPLTLYLVLATVLTTEEGVCRRLFSHVPSTGSCTRDSSVCLRFSNEYPGRPILDYLSPPTGTSTSTRYLVRLSLWVSSFFNSFSKAVKSQILCCIKCNTVL